MPFRVLVAGGGIAAAEVLLALRASAGADVELDLVTASPVLPVRALASVDGAAVPELSLDELCADVGARMRVDVVSAVAPVARRVRLASGGSAGYDALVLAVGARARVAVPGAVTFRDQRDSGRLEAMLAALTRAPGQRLVVAVPAGVTWSLPAYELALRAAALDADVTVVTPELAPLATVGPSGASSVARLLAERGVRVLRGSRPVGVEHGAVRLAFGGRVPADHVIALPALAAVRLPGVPASFGGFVPVGETGRVEDVDRIWAAGDMTTFPVKQGGIAAQQAQRVVADVAAVAADGEGADVRELEPLVLRARLAAGDLPLYLRAELDRFGDPIPGTDTAGPDAPWWPAAKVAARHLTPWIAAHVR